MKECEKRSTRQGQKPVMPILKVSKDVSLVE